MATHSSILAWRIPWTEESGGLQSMGWQRARHDLTTNIFFAGIMVTLKILERKCCLFFLNMKVKLLSLILPNII